MPVWRIPRAVVLTVVMQGMIVLSSSAQEAQPVPAQGQVPVPAAETPSAQTTPEEALVKRGIAQFQEGNYEEAFDDLSKAQAAGPRASTIAYYLGLTLKKMQSYEKALEPLKEATALQPAVKEAFLELADTYYALARYDEALLALEVADGAGVAPAQAAFLRGLVLAKKRKNKEAIASFDRAAQLDPGLQSAVDFQKATVLQREGRMSEARTLFLKVAEREPESATGSTAKQQVDAIEQSVKPASPFHLGAGLHIQYDSNVILKPDGVDIPGLISNQADMSAIATFQAAYAAPVASPWDLRIQYGLYADKHQDLSEFDTQSHTIAVIPSYRLGEKSLNLGLSYNYTFVDGNKYLAALAASPQYVFIPAEGQQAALSLRYQKKDFLQQPVTADENRDSTEIAAGISWNWLFDQKQGYVSARYEFNTEDAEGRNWSYSGHRVSATVLIPLREAWKTVLGVDVWRQTFDGVNTVFQQDRQDTTVTGSAQMLYGLSTAVDLQLSYSHIRGDSTIPVYAYMKDTITAGVNARF